MMNAAVKIGCRTFQLAFRLAIPLLPYREPECFDHIQALPPLLERLGNERLEAELRKASNYYVEKFVNNM